jgi:hypothetical protein
MSTPDQRSRSTAWIRGLSTPQQWKMRTKFAVLASLFVGGYAMMSALKFM